MPLGASGSWHSNDRVRRNTATEVNRELDQALLARLTRYAAGPRAALDRRLEELDREWDIERWLELNASALSLTTVLLALRGRRAWLGATVAITGFLLQHAVQGWCPPVPLFRRLGVRTRQEIDTEVFALKALRGDFAQVPLPAADAAGRARAALAAAGHAA
jgi:hypothetical protein